MEIDLRWLTAICMGLVGATLLYASIRIWFMPLHDRALLLGPIFTDKGLRWFLNALPLFAFFGMFLMVAGLSKWVYFARWWGAVSSGVAEPVGVLEGVIAVWLVLAFISAAWRFGRNEH